MLVATPRRRRPSRTTPTGGTRHTPCSAPAGRTAGRGDLFTQVYYVKSLCTLSLTVGLKKEQGRELWMCFSTIESESDKLKSED